MNRLSAFVGPVFLGGTLLIALLVGLPRRIADDEATPLEPSVEPLPVTFVSKPVPNASAAEALHSSYEAPATLPRQAGWKPSAHSAVARRNQDAPPEFSAFVRWTDHYALATGKEKVAMIPEGTPLAANRRAALAKLIRTDPESALAAAVPLIVRKQLPAELIALLEEPVAGNGELSLNCVLPTVGTTTPTGIVRRALVGRREYDAYTYGRRATLATLPKAFIEGIAVDRDLAVKDSPLAAGDLARYAADNQPGTTGVTGRPSRDWTHGAKRVLIIRVDFSDRPGTPIDSLNGQMITEDFAVDLFNSPNGVRDFYQQISYGQTTLQLAPTVGGNSPDVTGVLRLPQTAASYAASGNDLLLHSDARTAAQAAGFNVDSYDRIGVVLTSLSALPGSKINYGGFGNIIGKNFWVNGAFNFRIVAHEIGHNYGLHHANLWQVNDGNPVSATGSSTEYGDLYDLMGNGNTFTDHFSPWHKSLLQWIPDAAVTVVSNSGIYRVHRFDAAGANLSNPLALKVVRDLTHDYWVGYRRASGNPNLDNGACVLWGYNQNQACHLLDLNTPGSDLSDVALTVGTAFADSAAGVTLRTVARGGGDADEYLDVEVTFQPRLQLSSATYYADEQGGHAVITVNRLNNGTGAVSVNFTTINDSALAPSDYASTNGTLTWANGDLSPRTISIPIVPDGSPEGAESFAFVLSNPGGAVITGPASATVSIVEAGVGDPSFAPGLVNRSVERIIVQPDGRALIGGWFDTIYESGTSPQTRRGIARLEASGVLDTNYASAGGISAGDNERVEDLARQPDGKVIIVGNFSSVHGTARNRVARLNEDGSLDAGFDPGTGASATVRSVVLQPDGRVLLGGDFTNFNGGPREFLVRLNANGSVDASFAGPDFYDLLGSRVEHLGLQPDGRILVAGLFAFVGGATFKSGVCRLNNNGTLDPNFSGIAQGAHLNGSPSQLRIVRRVVPQVDGSFMIAGDFTAYNNTARGGLARLTSTGALDPGFAPTTDNASYALLVQPDGKVLVGGNFTTLNGTPVGHFGRLLSTGALDPNFTGAGINTFVNDFALQPDGRVMFASNIGKFGSASNSVWRFFSGLSALPGTVQWTTDIVSANEGTTATLTATRVGGSAGALKVNYAGVPGTASLTDFMPVSGTLSWTNGETAAKTVIVPLASDAVTEGTETLFINLGQPLVGAALLGNIQQVTLNITETITSFASWQAANFTPAELVDPSISGDSADPDSDGIKNLLEYAFGLLPKTPDTTGVPTGAISSVGGINYLTLTYRRRVTLADLTYTPRTAASVLGPWNADAVQAGSPINNGDGTETVTFRDSTPAGQPGSQRFMRVEISRTP